jgi:hypothetical protein
MPRSRRIFWQSQTLEMRLAVRKPVTPARRAPEMRVSLLIERKTSERFTSMRRPVGAAVPRLAAGCSPAFWGQPLQPEEKAGVWKRRVFWLPHDF